MLIFFNPLVFMQSNLNPGHYKASRIHECSAALIGDAEENATLSAAPNPRKISCQVSPATRTEIQMAQNPPVISGSTALLSLESDIISSDDDEEEDTCSSSNSLPSPEVFRKETSCEWSFCVSSTTMLDVLIFLFLPVSIVKAPIFSSKEEMSAVLKNKNSTLLDTSHAVSVHMHPAPNLSPIFGNLTESNSNLL